MKQWIKDAKKDSIIYDHVKLVDAKDELLVISHCNELMYLIYEILTKSSVGTGFEHCSYETSEFKPNTINL